ncbi:MAG: hypothetical protein ACI8PW_002041 [Methylophilaceae bacterium]
MVKSVDELGCLCEKKQDDGAKNFHENNGEQSFVASDLTLHLPDLGKVTAKN